MSATFHAVGNGEQTASAASFSITTTISAGDFLVVVSSWDSASTTTPTVATTGGAGSDTGTLILGPITAGSFGLKYAAWLVSSAGSGRTGVTVSWASSNPSFADGYCWSASGLTTPTLDKSPNTSGNSTNPSSGTTGTLSTSDQFCVSYAAAASVTISATGGGFTDDGNTGSTGSRAGHQVVAVNTALTGSFTAATSAWAALALTIKAGSTVAPFYKSDWGVQKDLPGITPQAYVRNPLLYPNPIPFNDQQQRHTRQVPLVGPPQSLPLNINLFTNPIPFSQADWAPAKPFFKVSQQTQPYNNSIYVTTVVAAPFYQTNWPIPKLQGPSTSFAQPNTLINLLAQPLIGPDLSTSKFQTPRAPDATQQTNINLFTNPIPFDQTDWPIVRKPLPASPQALPYNVSLYTVTAAPAPFFQNDWSATRFFAPRAPDASQATNINLFTNPIPFDQTDWPTVKKPLPAPPQAQPYNLSISTVIVAAAPFNQTSWPIVTRISASAAGQIQNLTLLNTLAPVPPPIVTTQQGGGGGTTGYPLLSNGHYGQLSNKARKKRLQREYDEALAVLLLLS